MSKIAFLGGGSFGSALSILLAKKGNDITLWDRKKSVIDDITNNRNNHKYLKDLKFPKNIFATEDMLLALKDSEFVILAVPSHAIREISKVIKPYIPKDAIVISIAKGIEQGSYKRLSQVIEEELDNSIVVFSGPSHAEEVSLDIPTTVVVSSKDMDKAKIVQDLFFTQSLRVYTNDDLIGVEIGGAVKNIIALAAGISDGIGYGDNAKAALMTRGMNEIMKIGECLGGRKETFFGLTGMGDLIVTCTSLHSRNRRAGILIGEGKTMDEAIESVGMVVEGIKSCKAFYELKEKLNISMPITDTLYKVLFQNKNPEEGVRELMKRDKKSETY